jgi:single-strand DNA-binding protein
MNKVILIGHLGADPEVRYLPNGDAACNFRMATNTRWTDKESKEKREHTEWHSCSLFGKRAEAFAQYVKKGHRVCVEGEMRTRKWTDKNNVERYTTEVRVRDFEFLQQASGNRPPPAETDKPDPEASASAPQPPPQKDFDDDIPF